MVRYLPVRSLGLSVYKMRIVPIVPTSKGYWTQMSAILKHCIANVKVLSKLLSWWKYKSQIIQKNSEVWVKGLTSCHTELVEGTVGVWPKEEKP